MSMFILYKQLIYIIKYNAETQDPLIHNAETQDPLIHNAETQDQDLHLVPKTLQSLG